MPYLQLIKTCNSPPETNRGTGVKADVQGEDNTISGKMAVINKQEREW